MIFLPIRPSINFTSFISRIGFSICSNFDLRKEKISFINFPNLVSLKNNFKPFNIFPISAIAPAMIPPNIANAPRIIASHLLDASSTFAKVGDRTKSGISFALNSGRPTFSSPLGKTTSFMALAKIRDMVCHRRFSVLERDESSLSLSPPFLLG